MHTKVEIRKSDGIHTARAVLCFQCHKVQAKTLSVFSPELLQTHAGPRSGAQLPPVTLLRLPRTWVPSSPVTVDAVRVLFSF